MNNVSRVFLGVLAVPVAKLEVHHASRFCNAPVVEVVVAASGLEGENLLAARHRKIRERVETTLCANVNSVLRASVHDPEAGKHAMIALVKLSRVLPASRLPPLANGV